jgi:protein O-GlcNAc transferase
VVNPSPRQDPGRTVSPEFRKHPVGYLTAEIFESHDPDRFEPNAFSIGPDDNSDLRKRLEKSFHRFVDCEHKVGGEVLKAIDHAQIDILVDFACHTNNARLSLFAASPAPIAVNYLGFAGTLGGGSSSTTSLPIQSCCQIKPANSSMRGRSFARQLHAAW